MTVASMTISEFRVGEVLGRSMSILGRNLVPFGLLAFIFTIPSLALAWLMDPQIGAGMFGPKQIQALEYGDPAAMARLPGQVAALIGLLVLHLVFVVLANGAMVYGTFQDLRGQRAGIVNCIRRGLGAIFPVIGVALLSALAMILGFVLLIFPFFMVMAALYVAIPAAVVERPGVIASLRRSAALTKGYRWRVFGIVVVLGLISSFATGMVEAPFALGSVTPTMLVAKYGISYVVTAFFTALGAVASAVAYHDLRAVKEGFDIDRFVAIFD